MFTLNLELYKYHKRLVPKIVYHKYFKYLQSPLIENISGEVLYIY